MKKLLAMALFSASASAGYSDCRSEFPFYNYKLDRIMEYSNCDGVEEDLEGFPSGVPESVEIRAFDSLNPGRVITTASMLLKPDPQETAFDVGAKLSAEQGVAITKDFKDFLKFWRDRGFEELKAIKLVRNEKLSKSVLGDRWSLHEIYDVPDSLLKVGWKMGVWKGRVQEPFVVFVQTADGKEKPFFEFARSPDWTFSGGHTADFYLDPKKKFLLLNFGGSWSGTYFVKLDKHKL
ncbi:MAG TPA: hypothetical protein VM901_00240 [Bdellovibrionota bacterium]|jgi:hypothetical protein|nr:hypothetical protein [Bdellovibrionota bacterium]